MWKKLCLVTAIALVSTSASAADSSSGCGPAWYILKDKSLVSSAGRAITNAILTPVVTLGMTFGTSNCGQHKIVDNEKRSEHLVMVAFDTLRHDAARGDGRFVAAYAQTFSCDKTVVPEFTKAVQKNYGRIFGDDASPQEVVDNTLSVLRDNTLLAASCSAA